MATKVIITKVDDSTPSPPVVAARPQLLPSAKKGGKHMKTFPRGVLKTLKSRLNLKPVSDPAKPPPLRKTMKKQMIHLMTDKGSRRHRKTLKKQISKLSDQKVKELVLKSGLLKNQNTPVGIMREMLEGGAIAGFVSLN